MIVRLCIGGGVSIALLSPALAELAMTGAPVTMRDGPSGKARIVQRIPQSAEIVLEKCVRNWCRAWWRRFGYVPAEVVVLGPPPATLPGDEMPPPLVYALPTYVMPPGVAMDRPLCWPKRGLWIRLSVAQIVSEREAHLSGCRQDDDAEPPYKTRTPAKV